MVSILYVLVGYMYIIGCVINIVMNNLGINYIDKFLGV